MRTQSMHNPCAVSVSAQLGANNSIYTRFVNGESLTVQLPEQIALMRQQETVVRLPSEAFRVFAGESETSPAQNV
jgi:antirestriction protein